MKENMRLSIIIPVYNAEKYIKNCLDSLLRQNVGGIEILCIDDGSTDFTAKIIKTYVEKYPFIKYYYKDNGGQSSARNYGIDKARGCYLWFVDSDDYIADNTIEQLLQYTSSVPDVLTFGIKEVTKSDCCQSEKNNLIKHYTSGKECFSNESCNNGPWWYWVKKELIIQEHLKFVNGRYCEDGMFTMKLFSLAQETVFTNLDVYRYYRNPNSTTTSTNILHRRKVCEDFLYAIQYLDKLYKENEENSSQVFLNVLRQRVFCYIFFLQVRMLGIFQIKEARLVLQTLKKENLYPYKWDAYNEFRYKVLNRLFQVKPIYLTMIETFRICADFKEKLKS